VNRNNLWDIDVWILISDKVDVWSWQIFTEDVPSGAAYFVVPFSGSVVDEGHASFISESIGLNRPIWLARGPIVELEKDLLH
jgi:hypothetical protein